MLKKSFLVSAIICAAVFSTTAQAQVTQVHRLAEQPLAQRDPQDPAQRDDSLAGDDLAELTEVAGTDGEAAASGAAPVSVSLRLNTELFVNSGDLVEFLVPIRYDPSDRLALEVVPVMKYFPESTSEEFDYGIKFAVEYRL
ncbi:MAG: hypothetical protein HC800_21440 [Phormidesmis sp. RL_2_1]|nr:hypothetical protein [Phormidesmis sp. RL_2_1]